MLCIFFIVNALSGYTRVCIPLWLLSCDANEIIWYYNKVTSARKVKSIDCWWTRLKNKFCLFMLDLIFTFDTYVSIHVYINFVYKITEIPTGGTVGKSITQESIRSRISPISLWKTMYTIKVVTLRKTKIFRTNDSESKSHRSNFILFLSLIFWR